MTKQEAGDRYSKAKSDMAKSFNDMKMFGRELKITTDDMSEEIRYIVELD